MFWIDLLLFAGLAAFFAYRLYQVLGKRHGEERERPNPFARPERQERQRQERAAEADDEGAPVFQLPSARVDAPPMPPEDDGQPVSLAVGLERIRAADPDFTEKDFVDGARAAFGMILKAYAEGDLATLRDLLAPAVLKPFEREIKAREKAGQVLTTELRALREVVIIAARLEAGRLALITTEFTSEQVNVTRDKDGAVVEGDPAQPEIVIDRWTWRRDTKSEDPNWLLVATGAAT